MRNIKRIIPGENEPAFKASPGWRRLALCVLSCALLLASGCGPQSPSVEATPQAATPAPAPVRYTIVGKVTLEGADRHSGIEVFLGGTRFLARTDSAGAYSIPDVPPGRYELLAEKSGYREAAIDSALNLPEAGPSSEIRIRAVALAKPSQAEGPATAPTQQTATLRGMALLEQATNHAGILVHLAGTSYGVETDSGGAYRLEGLPPGQYKISYKKTNYDTVETSATLKAGATVEAPPLALTFLGSETARAIRGRLRMFDESGNEKNDFAQAVVTIGETGLKTKPDSTGAFVFTGLPAETFTLAGVAEGYRQEEPVSVDLRQTATAQPEIVLRAGEAEEAPGVGDLAGQVIRGDGKENQSGISVGLLDTAFTASTDPRGGFQFKDIPEGMYDFYARSDGFDPLDLKGVVVADGETTDLGLQTLRREVIAPQIKETQPANGADGVSVVPRLPVVIRFSKPMREESVRQAFSISPYVAYAIAPGADKTEFRAELLGMDQKQYVKFKTTYTITIGAAASDADGVPMEKDYTFRFKTGGPSVTGSWPSDGEAGVSLAPDSPITIYLNSQLKPDSLQSRLVRISPRLSSQPRLNEIDDPSSGWTTIQIYGIWNPDTRYTVTLGRGIANIDGIRFEKTPYTITFRTAPWIPLSGPNYAPGKRIRR